MAEELSQEEINHIAGAVVENAMEAARECKEKHPYDPESFFRCCLPTFSQGMTHRGTDPEAIKVAERFGLVFDGMMEDLYEFTIAKGTEEAKGITFVVKDLSQVESRLAEKLKEFGIRGGNPITPKEREAGNPDKEHWQMTEAEYSQWAKSLEKRYNEILGEPVDPHSPVGREAEQRAFGQLKKETGLIELTFTDMAGMGHKAKVRIAISEGKLVPPEVLAAYPDLQKKGNPGEYVTIIDPGKTTFKVGEVVSHEAFAKENDRVIRLGEKPATGR